MLDPKFEKEVQKKLEELSFSPSEAIWANVERAVNEKKRRRVPLFWVFFLPALGLAGAGLFYFSGVRTVRTATNTQKTISAAAARNRNVPASDGSTPAAMQPAGAVVPGIAASKEITGGTASKIIPGMKALKVNSDLDVPKRTPDMTASKMIPGMSVARNRVKMDQVDRNRIKATVGHTDIRAVSNTDIGAASNIDIGAASSPAIETRNNKTVIVSSHDRVWSRPALPGLKDPALHFATITAAVPGSSRGLSQASSNAMTPAMHSPIKLQRKYSWEAGFAGGIGLSSLNKTLFQQPVVVSDLTPNAAPITGPPKGYSSAIQPGLSYRAGIVAERPLNQALTLSLGLDLHYYSARIQTGEKVYNDPAALYAASSLFINTGTGQGPRVVQGSAYPYYSVGDQDVYVNRYYFLELPVSVLWQVGHSRNLPIFWESGFSLSYLVSSNSLYFNSKSGVFYKDGSMSHKTQFNLATGLLVGLPIKGIRLQAGPQIQYGLSTLQNSGSAGQHLFYGGLRVVLLPGKAKK